MKKEIPSSKLFHPRRALIKGSRLCARAIQQTVICLILVGMTTAKAEVTSGSFELAGNTYQNVKPLHVTEGGLIFSHENGVGEVRLELLSLSTLVRIAADAPSIAEHPDFIAARASFLPSLTLKGVLHTGLRLKSVENGIYRISTDAGELAFPESEFSEEDRSALLRTFSPVPGPANPSPGFAEPGFGPGFAPSPGAAPAFGLPGPGVPNGPAPGVMSFNPFAMPTGGLPVPMPPSPTYQNPLVDTPPNSIEIPLAPAMPEPSPDSDRSAGGMETHGNEPEDELPEHEWTLLGTWRFQDGSLRTFTTDIPEDIQLAGSLKGAVVNAEGTIEGHWWQPNEFEAPNVSWPTHRNQLYQIRLTEGFGLRDKEGEPISGTVIVSLADPGYLVGNAEDAVNASPRIRARKLGFAPIERSSLSRNHTPRPDQTSPKAEVDRDFLKLIKAVSDPWTDDPMQAEDCTHVPLQEIERRMGAFDGGTNPEVRKLIAAIEAGRQRIEGAMKDAEARMADVDSDFEDTANRTTNFTGTDINGNWYSRTEVTGTTFGDVLGHWFLSAAARSGGEAMIRDEQEALAYQYWNTNLKLAELAPLMYGNTSPRQRLVEVAFSEDGFVIENVAAHTLTDLTVRIDLYHFSMVPKRYGCRLHHSSELHPGEKRYASVEQLQIDPEKERPYEIEWRPDRSGTTDKWLVSAGGICEMRVSAWSREGSQEVEVQRFPDSAKRGAAYEAKLVQAILANPSSQWYEVSLQRRFLELASKRILQLDPGNQEIATLASGTLARLGVSAMSPKEWDFETEPVIHYPEDPSQPMEWRDVDGRTVVATFVQVNEHELVIAKETGEQFTVPLARLDEASRAQAIRFSRR